MTNFKFLSWFTFSLSLVLFMFLLFFPAVVFVLFGVEGNVSAYFISRRAAMFFAGYAAISFLSRNTKPSPARQAIAMGVAVSMAGFAVLGLFEYFRGAVGAGIMPPVVTEIFLAVSYFRVWQADAKESHQVDQRPKVRATGILVENGKILLVQQNVTESQDRNWSLPGGGLEFGEGIEDCLEREILEETGLQVVVRDLLYICDRIEDGRHMVHLTFLLERIGGTLTRGVEPEKAANPIGDVRMVAIESH